MTSNEQPDLAVYPDELVKFVSAEVEVRCAIDSITC